MLNKEQSAANGWAVPGEVPVQGLQVHGLAGVECPADTD